MNAWPDATGPEETAMTYTLLCPVDGTDHALHAVDAAADLTQKYGGALLICVVNVAHGTGRGPLIHHWTDAEMNKVDHIVMGTGDKHGLSRLMLGSVAADVCARAHCSVTVAR
jgi:nucleotide-binding universal stress UspA family protein